MFRIQLRLNDDGRLPRFPQGQFINVLNLLFKFSSLLRHLIHDDLLPVPILNIAANFWLDFKSLLRDLTAIVDCLNATAFIRMIVVLLLCLQPLIKCRVLIINIQRVTTLNLFNTRALIHRTIVQYHWIRNPVRLI